MLIANIITAKQIKITDNIVMTSAIIVFPITYILSDVFSEIYGYHWSRVTCYIGFSANLFMVIVFQIAIVTPSPDYWTNQIAFQTVLGSTPRVLTASLLALVIGDFVNDNIFRKMKSKHPNNSRGFKARAILSSVGGNITDSLVFIPVAFTGQMPINAMLTMIFTQAILKTIYEVIMLPITDIVVKYISKRESGI